MGLQVLADAVQVRLQLVHVVMLVAMVREDVVQVVVQDVSVEAADLQVVLYGGRGGGGRGQSLGPSYTVKLHFLRADLVSVDFGHQPDAGVLLCLHVLSLKTEKTP